MQQKARDPLVTQGWDLPANRWAMETRITAPSVAAASEYQKPPPKIPSFTNTQPPMKEPTIPRMMSVMQPKPRPRAIFPASHPAVSPTRIQYKNPRGSTERRSQETDVCDANSHRTIENMRSLQVS